MVKRPVLLHQNDYMFDSLIGSDQNCARRGQQSEPFHAKGALVKADPGDESVAVRSSHRCVSRTLTAINMKVFQVFHASCVEKKIAFFFPGMLTRSRGRWQ
jgi:hypothetical protein